MSTTSEYLASKFKSLEPFKGRYSSFVFKNHYVDQHHHRIWINDDVKPGDVLSKRTIAGISPTCHDFSTYWLRAADGTMWGYMPPIEFEYNWNDIGTYVVPLDEINASQFNAFFESIYAQILLQIDKGSNIYVGTLPLFRKNSTYEVLLETELV